MTVTAPQVFLLPFFGHFGLVALLYAWLTLERQVAVARHEVEAKAFAQTGADPARSRRIARNLGNQFELPVFALFAAVIIYLKGHIGVIDIAAAWLFLFGRVIHTGVQTLSDNVPLRGVVFTINFAAVVVLMARAALLVFAQGA